MKIGPSFLELAKGYANVIENGKKIKVIVDSTYIVNSIINPNFQLVDGFKPNLMPNIEGRYTEDDLKKFVDLLLVKEVNAEN